MQGSHAWARDSAVFDETNLVVAAGLVPVLALAEQTGLSDLLDALVRFTCERVRSGAANATGKLTAIVAGMAAGADSIDDLDVVRSGGMRRGAMERPARSPPERTTSRSCEYAAPAAVPSRSLPRSRPPDPLAREQNKRVEQVARPVCWPARNLRGGPAATSRFVSSNTALSRAQAWDPCTESASLN